MVLTVYRQPVLTRTMTGPRSSTPSRTKAPLERFHYQSELRAKKRVAVRFPFGDWIEFRDNGEPCTEAMRDYVLAPESVALVRSARLKEKTAKVKARKAAMFG